eukprot:83306_1
MDANNCTKLTNINHTLSKSTQSQSPNTTNTNSNNNDILVSEEWKYIENNMYGLDWCANNNNIQQHLNQLIVSIEILTDMQKDTKSMNIQCEDQIRASMHASISKIIEYGGMELIIKFLHVNQLGVLARMIWCVEAEERVQWYEDKFALRLMDEFDIDLARDNVVNDPI